MNRRVLTLALAVLLALVLAGLLSGRGGSKAASRHLIAGQRVTFKPGAVAVGSEISCASHQARITVQVPSRGHVTRAISDSGNRARLSTQRDGSVVAACSSS